MKASLALLILFGIIVCARWIGAGIQHGTTGDATLALGFVLLGSYLVGEAAARVKLPRITGYLIAGVLAGPYLLPHLLSGFYLLSPTAMEDLRLIDGIALGLISFTAGGELKISTVRKCWKGVLSVTTAKVLVVLLGVAGSLLLAREAFVIFAGLGFGASVAICLLFATVALASSPATTIAVINEYRPKGQLTDLTLGVTVVKDVVVVVVFAFVLPSAKVLLDPEGHFDVVFLLRHLEEVAGSLVAGAVLGWLLVWYFRRLRRESGLVILAVAFCAMYLAENGHLSGILICMVAGFVVENFSEHGDDLIGAVEEHSLPVYVVFFTLAGAALDLGSLAVTWKLALCLAAARLVTTAVGTYLGARIAAQSRPIRLYGWMGFLGQAGLSLGFARQIVEEIPTSGTQIYTVLLAVVAINQLIGPGLFRFGLMRSGEVPEGRI